MRQQQRHLAAASHDLRDPLQVIASYVDLLAEGYCGPVNSDQHTYLMRVRTQVDYLSGVVDSILLLARAERVLALDLTDVPVAGLLAEVHTLLEPRAAAAGVSLTVECGGTAIAIPANRAVLRRVLTNLVGNAVKFTHRGGHVSLSALALPGVVELCVSDTGPGIESSQLDVIFEPFVRVPPTDELNRPGVGLGLSIARDLTRLLGGELVVRSIVGVGSRFVARLPAASQPSCADAAGPASKAA